MILNKTYIVSVELYDLSEENVVTIYSYDRFSKRETNVIKGEDAIKIYEKLKGNK